MKQEKLKTKIEDRGIGISKDRLTVKITASGRRKDDFEAVREAVQEVLDNDGE